MGLKNGLFHSEWKFDNKVAYLIECAARVPGDYIFELIEQSYGFRFLEQYLHILTGEPVYINEKANRISSIHYFSSKPGVLKKIEGLETLFSPEVFDWSIEKAIGDHIDVIESSWDRIGYFIVIAKDFTTLKQITNTILNSITFIVEENI